MLRMEKKQTLLLPLLIVVFLMVRFFFVRYINEWLELDTKSFTSAETLVYQAVWYLLPLLIILPLFYPLNRILPSLGLFKNPFNGFFPALILTSPMILAYPFIGSWPDWDLVQSTLILSLFAGFFEELFFRGFVFGQLFRKAGWGFIPAAALPGLFFAAGHLYQSNDVQGALTVFGVTFLGAAWFSWLFAESGYNIWLIVFLHFFMNLSWGMFSIDSTAAGSWIANIPRIITIGLSIAYILIFVRRKQKLQINRLNLLRNEAELI